MNFLCVCGFAEGTATIFNVRHCPPDSDVAACVLSFNAHSEVDTSVAHPFDNWLKNRNILEFLGVWEHLNNAGFKPIEFEGFKKEAGLNSGVRPGLRP